MDLSTIGRTPLHTRTEPSPSGPRLCSPNALTEIAILALLALLAAGVALWGVTGSGPLWMDAPRYANAGAAIYDWLSAGCPRDALHFYYENYRQYPAFSMPFHPPGYPAVLGVAFGVFGESYLTARVVVAVSWVLCGWLAYRLSRLLGIPRWPSAAGAALMLTTPELAVWSRDTMSEVPSLAVLLAASWLWVKWCHGGRGWWAVGACAVALLAFSFRVTTAGVLPGWALYALVAGGLTRRRAATAVAVGVVYLAVGAAWISFARQYSAHEMQADGKGEIARLLDVAYFRECGLSLAACGTVAVLLASAVACRIPGAVNRFWLCWFLGYLAFKLVVPTSLESRHFFTALPAVAGLAAGLLARLGRTPSGRWLAGGVVALGIAANVAQLMSCPSGLTGYAAVGKAAAELDRPGNVLLAVPHDQDLIFHFRASNPTECRRCIRSDRALAVRVSEYANQPTTVLAHTPDDVLDIIHRGRIRYMFTFVPDATSTDPRPEEMKLAEQTVRERPVLFRQVGDYPLRIDFYYSPGEGVPQSGRVQLWEYLPDLPPGADELPLVVPTASLWVAR